MGNCNGSSSSKESSKCTCTGNNGSDTNCNNCKDSSDTNCSDRSWETANRVLASDYDGLDLHVVASDYGLDLRVVGQ